MKILYYSRGYLGMRYTKWLIYPQQVLK
jgi:hypothetical protein